MTKTILMMSSVPLAKPWNGADKNLARFLVNHDPENRFIVHSTRATEWAHERLLVIPSSKPNPMPTFAQKMRTFMYLLQNAPKAEIVHIVTSFAQPSRLSIAMMYNWRKMYRGKLIHTIPSLGTAELLPSQFIADKTVVVSNYAKQRLEALAVPNVERIYPPLDAADFLPQVEPSSLKEKYQLGETAILYPAHYGDKSGISNIIAAFAQIASRFEKAVLVFACRSHVGQNPKEEAAKVLAEAQQAGIAQQVRVLEHVDDMPALMRACAITALVPAFMASKMDLPLVILESLLIGNPVIVTDMAPMNEVLLGDCGFAVAYGDIPALSSALETLLGDETQRQILGENGQNLVQRYCAPQEVIAQYQNIYQMSV